MLQSLGFGRNILNSDGTDSGALQELSSLQIQTFCKYLSPSKYPFRFDSQLDPACACEMNYLWLNKSLKLNN